MELSRTASTRSLRAVAGTELFPDFVRDMLGLSVEPEAKLEDAAEKEKQRWAQVNKRTQLWTTMSKAADPKRNSAYDDFSDSDEDDASSNGDTSGVTLGFADGNLANSPESSSTDKIGGLPSFWPVFENSVPDVAAAQCRECQAAMPLLAQINAPLDPEQCQDGALLEEEDRSRVLFLFGCIQKCCLSKPNR